LTDSMYVATKVPNDFYAVDVLGDVLVLLADRECYLAHVTGIKSNTGLSTVSFVKISNCTVSGAVVAMIVQCNISSHRYNEY